MRRLALIAPLVLAAAAEAGPGFWLPGMPPEGQGSWVFGLSSDGLVASGHWHDGNKQRGFSWTAAGGRDDFGLEPGMPGTIAVFGASSDGITLAGTMSDIGKPKHAYRWTGTGLLEDLGTLGNDPRSYADDISGDGQVVVGASEYSEFTEAYGQAFRWDPQSGMKGLGHLKPSHTYSRARGISRDGSTIVGSSESAGGSDAFIWTETAGMEQLPDLPNKPFGFATRATAVSADGSVAVGFAPADIPKNYSHAVRWVNGAVEDLGVLPGFLRSSMFAVSDDGTVVGGWVHGGPPAEAVVWTPSTGLTLLSDYLTANGVEVPGGVRLQEVDAVSGDGLTFAGVLVHLDSGVHEGFVATVPSPATVTVLLAPCFFRRRRARSSPISPQS